MELLAIRHAIAVDRTDEVADADRPLTDDGRRRFRKVVRGLRRLDLRVDRILTSPWRRAAETAELAIPLLRIGGGTEVTPLLAQAPTAELISQLAGYTVARIAVIGHEPWLGELLAMLLHGERRYGEALPLKKGGVAHLDGAATPAGMHLRALVPPKLLRKLAD